MVRLNNGRRAFRWAEPNVKFNVDNVNCIYFYKEEHLCQCKECLYYACRCTDATFCQHKKRKEDDVCKIGLDVNPAQLQPFDGIQKLNISDIVVKYLPSMPKGKLKALCAKRKQVEDVVYVKIKDNQFVLDGKHTNYMVAKEIGQEQVWAVMLSKEQRTIAKNIRCIGAEVYNEVNGRGVVQEIQGRFIVVQYGLGLLIKTSLYQAIQDGTIKDCAKKSQ